MDRMELVATLAEHALAPRRAIGSRPVRRSRNRAGAASGGNGFGARTG
jgi:hypothetical protein